MRVDLFSCIYPSAANPGYGPFVRSHADGLAARSGVSVHRIVSTHSPRGLPGKLWKYLYLHIRAWWSMRRPADVVHLHYGSAESLIAALPLWLRRGPKVITMHAGDIYGLEGKRAATRVAGWFLRRTDHFIAVSDELKQRLVRDLGVPHDRISVFDVGCDLGRFRPCTTDEKARLRERLGFAGTGPVVLFVGQLCNRKGVDLLFEAFARIEGDWQLVVAGQGERRHFEQFARDHGMADAVRWLGGVPNERLPDYYRAADFLVLPARAEGTPTVLIEAMASGIAIVATRVGGVPELIEHERNGLLVDSENIDGLRSAIERLILDPTLRLRLAQRALADVQAHSLDHRVDQTLAIYRRLLDRRGQD